MPITPDRVVAERYRLVECLGAGGMGEVWKAQDNKFVRDVHVAIKFLKEDETFDEDARNRTALARALWKGAASADLTFDFVVNLLVEAFNCDLQRDALVAAAEVRLVGDEIGPDQALGLFDQLVNDSTFNENAKHRQRLRDMFATEANSVAILQHPNLVRVTDYGEHEGSPFLVMDFINGSSLQQVIQRRQPLTLVRRLRLIEDLCEGLAYAHGKDLIHRDIKPANLIIDVESDRLKILDFGIARQRQVGQRTASVGIPIGTFCYMSPEQTRASRSLDHRSDIFAVGLVFYELLSSQRAFPSAGDVGELLGRIQREPPQPLRDLIQDLDPEIEAIVYKAIEKVPARRYQDLSEMRRAIEPIVERLEKEERLRRRTQGADTVIGRPRSLAQQLADLNDTAAAAFDAGDDAAVLELCQQIFALAPDDPEALALKERAEARRDARLVEALLRDARRELSGGDLTAAGQLLERPEIDPRDPHVRAFIDDLEAARRAQRVETLVQDARMFLATSEMDAALERAQAALELDPDNPDAARLIERARAHKKALRQQAVDAALADAEASVVAGRLPDAIRALSAFTGEPAADAMLAALLPKHDEQLARQQKVSEAVLRARSLIDAGEFERACELVVQTTALDRRNEQLGDLRRWLEPVVRAIEQLEEAVALFDQDDADEAEQRLGDAADVLNPHVIAHPTLQARLDEVAAARTAAVERDKAEQRRAAAAAEERRRRALRDEEEAQERAVAESVARVRDALASDAIERAERELAVLAGLPQSDAVAGTLSEELAAARQRARDAAAARQVDVARGLVARGDLEGAVTMLRAFTPAHPAIDAELEEVDAAIRAREGQRARVTETGRLRREIERRVDEALAGADARFAAGDRDDALALLTAFQPRHPRIDEHYAALSKEQARLQAAERVEIERARIESERVRAEAERREWLARAGAAADQQDYATALALLRERLSSDAGDLEARQQFDHILGDLRSAVAREPANRSFREALRQYAPPRRSRVPALAAAAVVIVLLLAGGTALWMQQAPSQAGPSLGAGTQGGTPPDDRTPGGGMKTGDGAGGIAPAPGRDGSGTSPTGGAPPKPEPPLPIPPPAPQFATLTVNFRPWARVQLRPSSPNAGEAPEAQLTPFTVTLPAGDYVLQADNGGLTASVKRTLRLEGGKIRVIAEDMPGFAADAIVNTLLGPVR